MKQTLLAAAIALILVGMLSFGTQHVTADSQSFTESHGPIIYLLRSLATTGLVVELKAIR